jgi:3-oxoacyl-[acyl-carrier-protein] synthase III
VATVIESVGVAGSPRRWRRRGARKLADAAARRALHRAGLVAGDIDLLLNAGLYHERNLGEPALAALIQEDIGANPEDPHDGGHGTFSFDVANGTCGMLTGIQVADGFLRSGTIRHALVVASDATPGHRLAPGFPFAPAGAAIACGWRPGAEGIQEIRFANRPDSEGDAELGGGDGLRATVAPERRGNRLTIEQDPGFAAAAGAWAADVASKLLADHGMAASDVDLVVANPLVPDFLHALAAGLELALQKLAAPANRHRVHTAALGVALEPVISRRGFDGKTTLLVSAGAGLTAGAALVRQ